MVLACGCTRIDQFAGGHQKEPSVANPHNKAGFFMYYEINVSLNGRHFFATAERSIQRAEDLKKVFVILDDKFPESEGYELSTTCSPQTGYGVSREEILNEA